MTGRYHAYIINDGGDFKVRPSVAAVDRTVSKDKEGNSVFLIRNLTGLTAVITFTSRRPTAPRGRPSARLPLVIGPHSVGSIPLSDRASGWYPYAVHFIDGRRSLPMTARGESGPGMAVDP